MEPKKPWVMPKWMEPFRPYIHNHGGNSIERLMNGNTTMRVNMPLAILEVAVSTQVTLLENLHREGLLKEGK